MLKKETKISLVWTIAFIMLFNALLSGYVYYQKQAILSGETVSEACFASGSSGGCADVQFSEYGSILGISVGLLGTVLFSFMTVLLASFAYSLKYNKPIRSAADLDFTRKFCIFAFSVSLVGAMYFIYLQFFALETICQYCMVIDSLTILVALAYIVTFKRGESLLV